MFLRLVPYILIAWMITACDMDAEYAREVSRTHNNLELSVPKGATVLEHVPTASGSAYGYVIFNFRGECFMMYTLTHQRAITRMKCK